MGEGGNPFDLAALWRAYTACRKGKRKAREAQRYAARLLDNLVATRDALASFNWRPSRTLCFVVSRPKLREIHAAHFADRVTHHAIVDRLNRIYEPVFIDDSYANRAGKGSHAAVDRLAAFMRSASQGGRLPVHALQLDIANYFNCIHRPTLFRLIQQRLVRAVRRQGLDRSEARALQAHCRALLEDDPGARARRQGSAARHGQIPPHKRLAGQPPGYGLPVGNLTSQFFANVYLNELDQFVKHELKARWYVRYVDDFVLLHPDPAVLLAWRGRIAAFLAERLKLWLKALPEPCPISRGVDFLGYVVFPGHRVVRRRVIRHFHARLAEYQRAHVRANALRLPPVARDRLRAQVASFLGHCRHAKAETVWQGALARFPWLHTLFDRPETARRSALRPAWTALAVTGLAGQCLALRRRQPGVQLIVQVGNRWRLQPPDSGLRPASGLLGRFALWDIPDSGDSMAAHTANTSNIPTGSTFSKRGKMRRRPHGRDMAIHPEYAAADLPGLRRRLKRAGQAHMLAAQTGHYKTGFKRREIVLIWRPDGPETPSFLSSNHRGES